MQEPILTTDFTPHTYFHKSLNLARGGSLEEALQAIDAAIIFSNNSPFYIYQKMKLLYKLGAYESCSKLITRQLDYLFKHASLYLVCRFIDYYQKLNNLNQEALETYLEKVHLPFCLATEYTDLLHSPKKSLLPLAKKATIQDHHKLCISYCDLLTKTKEFSSDIILLKAYSYHILGNLDKARTSYEHYLTLEQNNAVAYDELGLILMEKGLYLDALNAFTTATILAPENKDYHMHLGECHCSCKHYQQAAKIYESLHKAFPEDLQTYFNLSYTYQKYNKKRLYRKYNNKIKKQLKIHCSIDD